MTPPDFLLDDALHARRQSFDQIPVVNIAPLLDGSGAREVAREIRWALSNAGFMYVRGHGIEPDLVRRAFSATRAFFDLPLEQKMARHVRHSGTAMRGYIETFGENTDPTKTRDLKECFDIGPEAPGDTRPFFGANPWPDGLPGFRRAVEDYQAAMLRLSRVLLRGIAVSLDLRADHFEPMLRDPISIQRLLHYPPQSGAISEAVMGIGAHTDYGNLTILAQDDVGGLQVMNRAGVWVEGPPLPGTFVINIGDLLQRMTNDVYLANLHRVVNTSGRQRYSIPFFIDADYGAVFAPIPSCISADNPARYAPVRCGDHKWGRFRASFPHLAGTAA